MANEPRTYTTGEKALCPRCGKGLFLVGIGVSYQVVRTGEQWRGALPIEAIVLMCSNQRCRAMVEARKVA